MASKFTHSGNLIIAGFVSAIILMSFMVYKVMQNDIQMVTDNYYDKEAVYQKQLDATENALAYNDSISVRNLSNVIELKLPVSLSRNIDSGSIYFYSPANKANDKTFALQKKEDGIYLFDAKDWQRTRYEPQLSFSANGKSYYRRLFINF